MIRKRNLFKKIGLLACAFVCAVTAFIVPTFAYTEDNQGNLVSDNLINYKDINSNKFTDLGNNSFKLNWGGAVSTITLPYNNFNDNTQYSITITKIDGANYWAYQFYWNYNDNTSERFTNNQGISNGTYSFTSASNKTLSSISIVLNYEATFKDLMLNEGEPKSFEPYGKIYYSQNNYDNALNNDYGIFRLCSSIDLTLTWTDGSNKVDKYTWSSILNLMNEQPYIHCVNGTFSYDNHKLSTAFLDGTSNATAMWQFNFKNTYPLVKRFSSMIGSGYNLRYQIVDKNSSLFAYDNIDNDKIIDLTQYNDKQIGYIQLFTGNVNIAVSGTSLYISSDYNIAFTNGYNSGYEDGVKDGSEESLSIGYQEGYRDGKTEGYDEGYNEALGEDVTTRGFWGLLNSIFSFPVNMIKSVFNFEFMGINIASLITFIISIVIVALVIRKFTK